MPCPTTVGAVSGKPPLQPYRDPATAIDVFASPRRANVCLRSAPVRKADIEVRDLTARGRIRFLPVNMRGVSGPWGCCRGCVLISIVGLRTPCAGPSASAKLAGPHQSLVLHLAAVLGQKDLAKRCVKLTRWRNASPRHRAPLDSKEGALIKFTTDSAQPYRPFLPHVHPMASAIPRSSLVPFGAPSRRSASHQSGSRQPKATSKLSSQ